MRISLIAVALLFLAAIVDPSRSEEPPATLPFPFDPVLLQKEAAKDKDKTPPEPKKSLDIPAQDFTQAPSMDNTQNGGFSPHMLGDFPPTFSRVRVNVFGTLLTTTTTTIPGPAGGVSTTTTTRQIIPGTKTILVPNGGLGAFKIAENASPMPQDRVFGFYNYYGGLQAIDTGASGANGNAPFRSTTTSMSTPVLANGVAAKVTTTQSLSIPAATASNGSTSVNSGSFLNQEVAGFEKTFLGGDASIEVRVPGGQLHNVFNTINANRIGDVTIIGKYALLRNRDTGSVWSAGLGVTAPTGPSISTISGPIHDTLLQPWTGYVIPLDRFFVNAFHSVVVPTDVRDTTLLFNDVGLYYWLYRGQRNATLNFIVPMVETHITTPLDHRDLATAPIVVPDMVVLTGGVHFGLFRNGTLTLGAATPVTGQRTFNIETFVQLNWRF